MLFRALWPPGDLAPGLVTGLGRSSAPGPSGASGTGIPRRAPGRRSGPDRAFTPGPGRASSHRAWRGHRAFNYVYAIAAFAFRISRRLPPGHFHSHCRPVCHCSVAFPQPLFQHRASLRVRIAPPAIIGFAASPGRARANHFRQRLLITIAVSLPHNRYAQSNRLATTSFTTLTHIRSIPIVYNNIHRIR